MNRDKGFEYLDDTPVEVPVKLKAKRDGWTQMVQHVAAELSRRAQEQGGETLEDSLDFGPDEDEELPSRAERQYMQEEELLRDALEASRIARERRETARLMEKENARRKASKRDDDASGVASRNVRSGSRSGHAGAKDESGDSPGGGGSDETAGKRPAKS